MQNFWPDGSHHRGMSMATPAHIYVCRRDADVTDQTIADELFAAQI
jgi:hypothetical protein